MVKFKLITCILIMVVCIFFALEDSFINEKELRAVILLVVALFTYAKSLHLITKLDEPCGI